MWLVQNRKLNIMVTIEELFTYKNLNDTFYECFAANTDKHSNRVYYNGLLFNNLDLLDDLVSGRYRVSPTAHATIRERGKIREIESPVMRDRIVQKIICKQVFVKQLVPKFIYDNYSSVKHRGTTMARKRFENMLYKFLRQIDYDYENRGFIVLVDVKKFFNNIDHEVLKSMLAKDLDVSDELLHLIFYLIDESSEGGTGLNLGSELPQILAMYYLSKKDNYLKCRMGVKFYGRYADDIAVIVETKEEAYEILSAIKWQLSKVKLEINAKKTQIVKISHGFTYLQTKYKIVKSKGVYKVLKTPTRTKITRERRRIKAHKRQVEAGNIQFSEVYHWYKAYRCSLLTDYNAIEKTLKSLDDLFDSLFEGYVLPEKQTRKDLLLERSYTWNREPDSFLQAA